MNVMVTILYGQFEKGRQVYKLEQDLEFAGWEHRVGVYKGFPTDLVSLPWLFRLVASPTGKWAIGAIFHDMLYRTHYLPRLQSDQFFYKIMIDHDVPCWKAKGAYFVVRAFGWYRYNKYKNNINNYRRYGYVENIKRQRPLR